MSGTTLYSEKIGRVLLDGTYAKLTCREMHELQGAMRNPLPAQYDEIQGHCLRIRDTFQRHMSAIFKAPKLPFNPMEGLNESTIMRREASEDHLEDDVILSSLRIEDVRFVRSEVRPELGNFLKKPPVDNDDDDDIEEVVEMEQSYYDQVESYKVRREVEVREGAMREVEMREVAMREGVRREVEMREVDPLNSSRLLVEAANNSAPTDLESEEEVFPEDDDENEEVLNETVQATEEAMRSIIRLPSEGRITTLSEVHRKLHHS
jgi:hypothetical protein